MFHRSPIFILLSNKRLRSRSVASLIFDLFKQRSYPSSSTTCMNQLAQWIILHLYFRSFRQWSSLKGRKILCIESCKWSRFSPDSKSSDLICALIFLKLPPKWYFEVPRFCDFNSICLIWPAIFSVEMETSDIHYSPSLSVYLVWQEIHKTWAKIDKTLQNPYQIFRNLVTSSNIDNSSYLLQTW